MLKPPPVRFERVDRGLLGRAGRGSKESESKAFRLHELAKDARVTRAVDYIEANFKEPLSVEEIAKHSGLSLRSLNRICLDELSFSPKQMVLFCRMEKAKRLLNKRDTSVTDVALEVGHSSLSQFIHAFRKVTGKLPSDFR